MNQVTLVQHVINKGVVMRKEVIEKQKEKEVKNYTPNNQTVSYDSKLKKIRRREPTLSRLKRKNIEKI